MQLNTSQFTGTTNYYRHNLLPRIVYTDGVHYVAETAQAYWFLDTIVAHQLDQKIAMQPFQVWKLAVTGTKGTIKVEDGNGNAFFTQELDFTDFPAPGVEMWFTDNTILLPSEY